jgi:hypothetical protein
LFFPVKLNFTQALNLKHSTFRHFGIKLDQNYKLLSALAKKGIHQLGNALLKIFYDKNKKTGLKIIY